MQRPLDAWTWRQFDKKVRPMSRGQLLRRLPEFPRCVLVAGCQRSGTTLLGKVLAEAEGFGHFTFAKFPELSAALVLAGIDGSTLSDRVVFQTTYLDDAWQEYESILPGQSVIWVLRNPHSVVTSMLYNWPGFAVNDTLARCGWKRLPPRARRWYKSLGSWTVPRIERACAIYNQKLLQLQDLHASMRQGSFLVVDYDQLVDNPTQELEMIAKFLDCGLAHFAGSQIHRSSKAKAERLSAKQSALIESRCGEGYRRCAEIVGSSVAG